jgi:hypothetical protein
VFCIAMACERNKIKAGAQCWLGKQNRRAGALSCAARGLGQHDAKF